MPLRGHESSTPRNPWGWTAGLLIAAIAAIGLSSAHNSGAVAEPVALIKDLLKKKGADKAKQAIPGKKQLTTAPVPGKGVVPGIKGVVPGSKTAVPGGPGLPKNTVGTAPGSNVGVPKAGPSTNPKAVLGKGADPKNAKGPLTKGADPKGATTAALPKGPATAALPKGVGPKGLAPTALPKGVNPKGPFASPRLAATAPERMRLRNDHRLALFTAQRMAQRLLPPRPLPGERGFTGVPPVGETRFVTTELVFRAGPNVSRPALDAAAQRLGLTVISVEDFGIAGGTIYHFRVIGRQVAEVVRNLETQNIGVAQPNYTYRLFQEAEPDLAARPDAGAPAQAANSEQYVVSKLHLDEAHKIATGNNVLIAVIDSAIDVKHPDLAGAVIEQYDAVGRNERPHAHGTGMVGAIAARQRLMGIAPAAKILSVRASVRAPRSRRKPPPAISWRGSNGRSRKAPASST
jgi:hypothetical protein